MAAGPTTYVLLCYFVVQTGAPDCVKETAQEAVNDAIISNGANFRKWEPNGRTPIILYPTEAPPEGYVEGNHDAWLFDKPLAEKQSDLPPHVRRKAGNGQ